MIFNGRRARILHFGQLFGGAAVGVLSLIVRVRCHCVLQRFGALLGVMVEVQDAAADLCSPHSESYTGEAIILISHYDLIVSRAACLKVQSVCAILPLVHTQVPTAHLYFCRHFPFISVSSAA